MIRQAGEQSYSEADMEFMNGLFRELKGCFPAWGVHLKNTAIQDETKRQWLQSFRENSINSDELVKIGMIQARKQPTDFLPSCGKFAEWCRPKVHHEHRAQEKAAQVPVGRWLTDEGSKARIQAAKEATLEQLRKPSKKLTKEETDAMLKSLDR